MEDSYKLLPLSLWQILLKIIPARSNPPLTCDECFILLDHLAEQLAGGTALDSLLQAIHRHLAHCPECREHHLQRLRELEARLARQDDATSGSGH